MHWISLLSYVASAFAAGALLMKRMIPLRLMIIVGNALFVVYGALSGEYFTMALHAVLLPLNAWRLREMQELIKKVEIASDGTISMDWLTTFMRRERVKAGDILFSRGDPASELFYIVSGTFRIPELGVDLGEGKMVGEVGLLAPEQKRSQSMQCIVEGDLLVVSYDEVNELYFQNPEFGYHFLKLITSRLFSDLARLEKELSARKTLTPMRLDGHG